MKFARYEDIGEKRHLDKTIQVIRDVIPRLRGYAHSERDKGDIEESLITQLPYLLYVAEGYLGDKKVLDLGCGSNDFKFPYGKVSRHFEPWLCRTLHVYGLSPIGVDILDDDGEEFERHTVDLMNPDSLSFLPDGSVDIANAGALFTMPELDYESLRRSLIPQLERVVKPEGYFVYSDLN